MHMSGIDGLTLLRQFRTDVAETPVMVMTANLTESVENEASQAGLPDVVIAKMQAALQHTPPW